MNLSYLKIVKTVLSLELVFSHVGLTGKNLLKVNSEFYYLLYQPRNKETLTYKWANVLLIFDKAGYFLLICQISV